MSKAATICQHLFSLANRGIKYDLERIRKAAAQCGNPQLNYKSVHVAGTNGKGSTCTYIESVLRKSVFKTGMYLSPHIVSFEERFLINGSPIDESEWIDVYIKQQKIIDDLKLTFFEATTLMAFELFRRNDVDWAVFETGLGGRLDATNVIDPQVSVITRIDLDHTEYLGPTILSIANEKLGIVKNNRPLIFAHTDDKQVLELARQICDEKNAPFHVVKNSDAELICDDENGLRFSWNGNNYKVPLRGSFQLTNALLALNALRSINITDYRVLYEGLASAFIPGRFQTMSIESKTVILDVGHNPNAASVFADGIQKKYAGKSICVISGIMKDKDTKGILENYSRIADYLIFTRPQIPRAADPEDLFNQMMLINNKIKCEVIASVGGAIKSAFNRSEEIICISGSFYTVGEAFTAMRIKPYVQC